MGWGTTREGLMPVSGSVSMGDACPQSQGPHPQHPTHSTAATAAQGPTPEVHGHLQPRPHLPPPGGVVSDSSPGHHPLALGLHPPVLCSSTTSISKHWLPPQPPADVGDMPRCPPAAWGWGTQPRSPAEHRLLLSKPNFLAGLRESQGAPPSLPSKGERSEPFFLIGLIYSVVQM